MIEKIYNKYIIHKVKEECDCNNKTIIVEGDGMFVARETHCKKHGYYTSCWLCNGNSTTEICKKCSDNLKSENNGIKRY